MAHERVPSPGIYLGGKPVLLMPEGSKREKGRDALTIHQEIANNVRDLVKSCFGPNGMYKLILSDSGASFLTSDSLTILSRVKLQHPLAQVIAGSGVDAAKSSGGGSTTTILLATGLLNSLLPLVKLDCKPATILKGVYRAYSRVRDVAPTFSFRPRDPAVLVPRITEISLYGTLLSNYRTIFGRLVSEIVRALRVLERKDYDGLDDVYFRDVLGGSLAESRLINGVALMREPIHPRMPKHFEDARVLLVKGEFQMPKQGRTQYYEHKFRVSSPEEYGKLLNSKRTVLTGLLGKVFDVGAEVVIVEKGVDETIVDYAVSKGVAVIRRFPPPEFDHLVRAAGATPVSDFQDVSPDNLVTVERADYVKLGDSWWWLLEGFGDSGSCEVLLRGSDQLFFDEAHRLLKGCLRQVKLYLQNPALTYGGGWFEMMVAKDLRNYARTIPSREQMAVESVAEAFETIPMLLAESAGLNEIDALVELRSRLRRKDNKFGVDGQSRRITDVRKLDLVEPLHVKMQALKSAFETVITIVRVDDVIRSRRFTKEEEYYTERVEKTSPEARKKLEREYGL